MRAEKVITNLSCNQNCVYCNSRSDRDIPSWIAPAAVRQRILQAISNGAQRIILSGGEPTLRKDIVQLVVFAKQHNVQVEIETNATLITPNLAQALAQAKLDQATVNLTAWDSTLDSITQDDGGFNKTLEGIHELLRHHISIQLRAVLIQATKDHLVSLVYAIAKHFGNEPLIEQLRLTIPVESQDETQLLPYDQAVPIILQLDHACRSVGLTLTLSPDRAPPPCVFPLGPRQHILFSLTKGGSKRSGYFRGKECDQCNVNDRCPGVAQAYVQRLVGSFPNRSQTTAHVEDSP